MKKLILLLFAAALFLTGCQGKEYGVKKAPTDGAVEIMLSDKEVTVDGKHASIDPAHAVYTANDIVYYPAGKDFRFGEGTDSDVHEADEAEVHTVVHITKAGAYKISGKLSAGQIAVDLGEDAKNDEDAVVTLLLNGVDISCSVAPAVIFYNVYECDTAEEHGEIVDTTAAGANVFIMDNTVNNIDGSYVARIYDPETVVLSADGNSVEDADKLHKYDGAFYSCMSMNIDGNNGILNINAENEGLDSERHLTINGGDIHITSGNDGINTNEDEVSVTTINDGILTINVLGTTGEGDGIDSNGWLVINGGTVISSACAVSGDAGIDSDMGIYINGGTVLASGNMLDRIAGGEQTYAVFSFAESQKGGKSYSLKNEKGNEVLSAAPVNDFKYLILAGDTLKKGSYAFWCGDTQLEAVSEQGRGMQPPGNMERPEGMEPPDEMPEGMQKPENGDMPKDLKRPEEKQGDQQTVQKEMPPELPENMPQDGHRENKEQSDGEKSEIFAISQGGNYFSSVNNI